MKDHWWKYAILALAGITWWYFQTESNSKRAQDIAQWQETAKVRACFAEDISRVKERLSYLEGYHLHEKECKGK